MDMPCALALAIAASIPFHQKVFFFCWTWPHAIPASQRRMLPIFAIGFSPLAICGTCIPNATSGIGLAATAMGATATVEPSSAALVSAAVIIRRIEEALPFTIHVLPNRCARMLTRGLPKTSERHLHRGK